MREFAAQFEVEGSDPLAGDEARDSEARFSALVDRQARFIFRVANALLRNAYEAEEVVQETFVKVYQGGRWEAIADEKAFLATVAWRIATEKLAKRKRERQRDVGVQEIPSREADPEQGAISSNRNAIVRGLVDGLPEELRQPLALSAVEGLNSREIARAMGIAEGTVRTRVMRARRLLKQKLEVLIGGRYEH